MHRADAAVDDAVLRKKEQKDVELDKKILALRKKNEALIRRYQEIEEDKKRAEQEGMAVTSRRPKQDGLTITITKAHNDLKDAITQTEHYGQDSPGLLMDKRVVSEKWGSPCPTSPGFDVGSEEEEEEEETDHMFTFRMGKRMQLAVTMDNKAKTEERRMAEKRRSESNRGPESDHGRKEGGKSAQKSPGDLNFHMTGRERSEYIRWKRERDQIDLERLARHKNAKGEWRRAWDVEKSEHMFEEDFVKDGEPALDNPSNKKGGRNSRKFQHRSFPSEGKGGGQHSVNVSDPGPRAVPAVSSRARGKDRLTGRARRWDTKEGDNMSFLKDDPDSQRILGTDKLKSRGEEEVEENCLTELEEKVKQPNLPDYGASSSQGLQSGKVPSAHNGQKGELRAVKGCREVPVAITGDTEPGTKLSKENIGEDASGKPGTADLPQEKESTKSSAPQSSLPSAVQAIRHSSEEKMSLPLGADLEKSRASERESTEDSLNSHGGKLDTAAGGRWEAGQGQLVQKRGEEVTENTALEGQMLALKGGDDAVGTEHRGEPLPPREESSNKTVKSEQDPAKSQSNKWDQPEECKDKDSKDFMN
ncbi:coiled-coil domain-containing protein 9B isoform X4 [Rhea pennata]|uniref:coiled-coil domain-containing protein 9B isoform X4 n=1 Tax=Rhea pennata TaxID=8795 RepID=UPI002E268756